MHEDRRVQAKGSASPLAATHEDKFCSTSNTGLQGQTFERAKTGLHRGEEVGKAFGAVYEGREALGGEATGGGIDPDLKGEVFAHSGFAARIRGAASGGAVKIGRVGDHMGELALAQVGGEGGEVCFDYVEWKGVGGSVFAGKGGIGGLQFDAG